MSLLQASYKVSSYIDNKLTGNSYTFKLNLCGKLSMGNLPINMILSAIKNNLNVPIQCPMKKVIMALQSTLKDFLIFPHFPEHPNDNQKHENTKRRDSQVDDSIWHVQFRNETSWNFHGTNKSRNDFLIWNDFAVFEGIIVVKLILWNKIFIWILSIKLIA